jgi:hypothetical protein
MRRRRRVEVLPPADHRIQPPQRLGDDRRQVLGQRGRADAVAFADEQRILQQDPQPVQRVGQGRLGDPQPRRGAGDVAILHQGQEDRQQVQVRAHPVIISREYQKSKKQISRMGVASPSSPHRT